jgi:D-arabinono-1,4-lactone oxidase/FAD binding domain
MIFERESTNQLVAALEEQQLNVTQSKRFKNFCGTVELPDALVIDAHDIPSLQATLKTIHEYNKGLVAAKIPARERITANFAAGDGGYYTNSFSLTQLIKSDVVLRYVGEKEIKVIDEDNGIVEVSAFYQMGELNKLLYEKYHLVLPTAPLIPWVTLGGSLATDVHGTGEDQPSVNGLVVAMTFARPDGSLHTIKEGDPNFETIRSAPLGQFGVLVSAQLKCAPRAKLECKVKSRSLPAAAKLIDEGLFNNPNGKKPYIELLYMPTYGVGNEFDDLNNPDKQNVSIRKMKLVPVEDDDKNEHPDFDFWAHQFALTFGSIIKLDELLAYAPELTRPFMNYFATRAEIGTNDKTVVGPWYDVWHYLKAYPGNIVDLDLLVPISADGHELREIREIINQKLKEYAQRGLFPINLGIYMRYFKGTPGALSTSAVGEDQHVLGLDFVSYKDTPGAQEFMAEIAAILTNEPYNAKPHWGKNLPTNVNYKRLYPKMDDYKVVLEDWHKDCGSDLMHSAFLNETCCDILQLPEEYYPHPVQNAALTENDKSFSTSDSMFAPSTRNKIKMAASIMDVISKIDGEDEHAKELRQALHKVGNRDLYDSSSNLFQKPTVSSTHKNEVDYDVLVNTRPCFPCNIF